MRYLNVENVERVSENIYELFLVKGDLEYKVGNCISIYGPDGQTTRPYSFSSSPNSPFVSFLIKRFPEGYVSTYLTTLKQGDRVKMSNPFGWFDPGTHPNSIFVATGTGIAPFVSSIRSKLNPPMRFFYGCRYSFDVVNFADSLDNVHVALSKETINSPILPFHKVHFHQNKRVTDLLEIEFRCRSEHFMDKHFYLCGLDTMIMDCIEILTKNDIDLDHIHHETFFTSES